MKINTIATGADIKRDKTNDIIISKGLLAELYRLGVTKDQLPSLKVLSDCMDASYRRSNTGNFVIKCTAKLLGEYFDTVDNGEECQKCGVN